MTFGQWGEMKAAEYLQSIGCRVLERNFRCRGGEVDLIVQDGSVIVFVEVKARRSLACGAPGLAVTSEKMRKLRVASELYLKRKGLTERDRRMDLIEILHALGKTSLRHTKGIF